MEETQERHEPARWYVRIDHWQPTKLNQLVNSHWAIRNRLKKHDAALVSLSVIGADVPQAEHRRRVSLEIVLGPGQRAGDPDAYWKSVLDALVRCRALKDDNRQWCDLGPVTFSRGKWPATVICLENLYHGGDETVGAQEKRARREKLKLYEAS